MVFEGIKNFIGLNNKQISLENKLFNVVCFVVGLSMIFGVMVNLLLNFPPELIYVEVFLGLISAFAFYNSRYKGYNDRIALIYIIIGLLMFLPGWFLNGGIEGSTTQIAVFLIGIILFLLPTRYHFFFILLLIAIFYCCFEIEKLFPNLVVKAKNNAQKETDLLISAIWNIFIVGVLISFLKRIHQKDKHELIQKSNELEKSKMELSLAKDEAEAATRIKSNFLARMSHEIRTPLTGVIGTTELLSETDLSAEQHQLIQMLQSSSSLLINIVNDILDLSKIEAESLAISLTESGIKKCIENTIKITTPYLKFAGKDIQIKFSIDPDVESVFLFDENRVQQVLINLISNAIKFTEKGSVQLNVYPLKKSKNFQEIVFCVKDTGIGISEESITKLFLPFSQINNNFTEKYNGTGLGLSICKKLVELMGGKIWVESKEGRGSEFSFMLPLQIVTNLKHQESVIAPANQIDVSLLRILLVEDNNINQIIAGKMFEKLRCKVDFASNGFIAVQMQNQKNYDIIFMDIQMPVMNGIEATKIILDKFKNNGPLIIAMSANVLSTDEAEYKKAGMCGFIGKPFKLENILEVLQFWGATKLKVQNTL